MNRGVKPLLNWLGSALLVSGLSGCITYTGEYTDDGYYGSPTGGSTYSQGYYGDYYYSAVPTISISYNLSFGYPYYGYVGCRYWSPYCSLFYPGYGYGYGYGPGYGFGWGYPPYYGYQPPHRPHHKPKPKPPGEQHNPPPTQQPIVRGRPIRALPGYLAHPKPQQRAQSQLATQPVPNGSSKPVIVTPAAPAGTPAQRTTTWRIPVNQRPAAPMVRPDAPAQREDNRTGTGYGKIVDYAQVEHAPRAGNPPVRINNPKPVNMSGPAVTQDVRPDTAPERPARQVVREPKQAPAVQSRKADVSTGEDP